jgi:hypothetical protein
MAPRGPSPPPAGLRPAIFPLQGEVKRKRETESRAAEEEISRRADVHAMAQPALQGPPRLGDAGAVRSARALGRLQKEEALPAAPYLPRRSVRLLLAAPADAVAGAMPARRRAVRAAQGDGEYRAGVGGVSAFHPSPQSGGGGARSAPVGARGADASLNGRDNASAQHAPSTALRSLREARAVPLPRYASLRGGRMQTGRALARTSS